MVEQFVATHLSLLAAEHEAELVESSCLLSGALQNPRELEARGVCLTKMILASQEIGLYGRQLLSFVRIGRGKRVLPVNCIKPGDIVGVFVSGCSLGLDHPLSGVVTKCSDVVCVVAFEDIPDQANLAAHAGMIQLVRLANEVTYKRLKEALNHLHQSKPSHLISVLFNEALPSSPDPRWAQMLDSTSESPGTSGFVFFNPLLDPSQRRAVLFALSRPDAAIIHGPPGTGKTTTVVEVILQCAKQRQKVLACAPSNIAVDNMVERLSSHGLKLVRLGHPARLVPSVLAHSLDSLLAASDGAIILQDCRKDLSAALSKVGRARYADVKRKWRTEVKELKKELLLRQAKLVKEMLMGADVILATNTGLSADGPLKHVPKEFFDVLVIDECAQALEASCWIPLQYSTKCILAGDHKQLPPTILSEQAAARGLSTTLMERLVESYGDQITTMLTTQYRMHQMIMEWPSQSLYNGCLQAHSTVAGHLLMDLPNVADTPDTSIPLLFIDTAGCFLYERETESGGESKGNDGEVDIVIYHLKSLLDAGVPAGDMAVIAPYNLQVDLIRQSLTRIETSISYPINQLEVSTVDGFQGREKEAVIISFTRSNTKGECGFLKEQRRTNVAVTRARRHLALIGDSSTITNEPFISGLLDQCNQCGEVRTIHEYLHDDSFEWTSISSVKKKTPNTCIQSTPISGVEERGRALKKLTQREAAKTRREENAKSDNAPFDSEARNTLRLQYVQQIEKFVAGDSDTLSFSSSLNSHQRRLVHELAEERGLIHSSKGQGHERFIVVEKHSGASASKTTISSNVHSSAAGMPVYENKNCEEEEEEVKDEEEEEEAMEEEVKIKEMKEEDESGSCDIELPIVCTFCGHTIPLSNMELHRLRCSKRPAAECAKTKPHHSSAAAGVTNTKSSQTVGGMKDLSAKPKPVSRKKRGGGRGGKVDIHEDDLDSLLAEMKISDSKCSFSGCRKSTNVLSTKCPFCSSKFCFDHGLAEIHGCGDAAKRHARQQIERELKRGASSRGVKPMNPTHKAQLHKQLERKIDKLSSDRQRKKPHS